MKVEISIFVLDFLHFSILFCTLPFISNLNNISNKFTFTFEWISSSIRLIFELGNLGSRSKLCPQWLLKNCLKRELAIGGTNFSSRGAGSGAKFWIAIWEIVASASIDIVRFSFPVDGSKNRVSLASERRWFLISLTSFSVNIVGLSFRFSAPRSPSERRDFWNFSYHVFL